MCRSDAALKNVVDGFGITVREQYVIHPKDMFIPVRCSWPDDSLRTYLAELDKKQTRDRRTDGALSHETSLGDEWSHTAGAFGL